MSIASKIKQETINKTSVSRQYLLEVVEKYHEEVTRLHAALGRWRPSMLKIGDIIFVGSSGIPHPCIVYKIKQGFAYSVVVTSKDTHSVKEVTNSRMLNSSFYSYSIVRTPIALALENYIGVFDNMKELREALKLIKEFYKQIL